MWIKRSGQSPIRVQFDATLDSSHVFTNDLYITDMVSEDITSLYIDTASASGRDVHCVSLDGQREKILTNVRDYRVCNGRVVYIDKHDNLYLATLSGALVSDQKQLASAVDGFEMSRGGEYVYFMKDCADNAGTLFCYKIGAEEPLKVAEDVLPTQTITMCGCNFILRWTALRFSSIKTWGENLLFMRKLVH